LIGLNICSSSADLMVVLFFCFSLDEWVCCARFDQMHKLTSRISYSNFLVIRNQRDIILSPEQFPRSPTSHDDLFLSILVYNNVARNGTITEPRKMNAALSSLETSGVRRCFAWQTCLTSNQLSETLTNEG
jgi:hypothetical protein